MAVDPVSLLVGGVLGAGGAALLACQREHARVPDGLADLLGWGFLVDEGVVALKDGGLLAAFRYRGPDLGSATGPELAALTEQLNDALLPFGDGWMFHVDAIREPAPPYAASRFPDPVTAWIDAERRQAYDAVSGVGERSHATPDERSRGADRRAGTPRPGTPRIGSPRTGERRTAAARPQFVSLYTLTATFLPPKELYTRAGRLFVQPGDRPPHGGTEHTGAAIAPGDPASAAGAASGGAWEAMLAGYTEALRTLEDRLGARLHVERLGSDALVTHLHRTLTGLAHPVEAPPAGAYLDQVLASQELVGGFAPRVGDQHLRVVAITGYPATATAGRLDVLNTLPFAYRWSSRFVPLSQHAAEKLLKRHQQQWFMGRKGLGSFLRDIASTSAPSDWQRQQEETLFVDQHASAMARDVADAMAENASGAVRFGLSSQVVVTWDRDPDVAEAHARAVRRTLQDAGVTARVETVNALDAFLGTLPGHGYANLRRQVISTPNAAALWPVTSVWAGQGEHPSPFFPPASPPLMTVATDGSTPFRLNLHVSDLGHTLLVGAPGAGKSTFVGLTIAQWQRYAASAGARTFVFDVGYSHWLLAKAAGGAHYDIAAPGAEDSAGGGAPLAFQPLADVERAEERAWAASWLEMLCELQGVAMTPTRRLALDRALVLLAGQPRPYRTLTELAVQCQDPDVVAALQPYTVGGAWGALLDAHEDALDRADEAGQGGVSRYQVFELRSLLDLDEKVLVPVLLYLFRRVERQLDGRPALIVIEELWAPLMRTAFANRIRQWLLTLRKQNAAVLLVAHTLAQLDSVPAKQVLIESCPTRVLLPNPEAGSAVNRRLYAELGLNDREIAIIAQAVPKRDYYVASPLGRRLVRLDLGPVALAFLGTPPGLTLDRLRPAVETLAAREGRRWPAAWLARWGIAVPDVLGPEAPEQDASAWDAPAWDTLSRHDPARPPDALSRHGIPPERAPVVDLPVGRPRIHDADRTPALHPVSPAASAPWRAMPDLPPAAAEDAHAPV